MSDIQVALSSTGHLVQVEGPPELTKLLKDYNYPVCVADIGLGLIGWGKDQERQELRLAQMCKEMAKTVFVDSKRRYVFVGKDPEIPESGLIEYVNNDAINPCSDSFLNSGIYWNLFLWSSMP